MLPLILRLALSNTMMCQKLGEVGRNHPKLKMSMADDMPGVYKIPMVRMFSSKTDEPVNVRTQNT